MKIIITFKIFCLANPCTLGRSLCPTLWDPFSKRNLRIFDPNFWGKLKALSGGDLTLHN